MDRSFKTKLAVLIFVFALLNVSLAFAKKSPINIDWSSSLSGGGKAAHKRLNFATPHITTDRVYVGNSGGFLYAVDTAKGKKVWKVELEGPILSEPLVEGASLFIGDGKGFAYAINTESGQINWKVFIGEEIMARPATNGSFIFISTQNNSMLALDRESGAIKWSASRSTPFAKYTLKGASNPVVIDGRVYVGNTDGVLVAYNATSGEKVLVVPVTAERSLFTDIDTEPLKTNGKLIFSTMEGALIAADYKTGKEFWTQAIATPNNIAYSEGNLFLTAGDKVYCLAAENGEKVWEKQLKKVTALSTPAVSGGYIVVASTDDKLYILDRADGEVIIERHLGGGTFGSPVIADGRIFILSNNNQLYAFRLQN